MTKSAELVLLETPAPAKSLGLTGAMSRGALALADQAVVSGTNFVTTIIIGRACGLTELGIYSIGFTVLVVITCIQEGLVAAPYTVQVNRLKSGYCAERAGSLILQHFGLALGVTFLLAAMALWTQVIALDSTTARFLAVLAIAVPFVLMREIQRRFAFAHLNFGSALTLDVAVAVLQLGALAGLAGVRALSALQAMQVVAVASAMVGLFMFISNRKSFQICPQRLIADFRYSWSFGRWLLAGQVISVVHGFVSYWMVGLLLGAEATGLFAACMTILMLCNPLILGLGNFLGPTIARQAGNAGQQAVRRMLSGTMTLLAASMSLFVALIMLRGDWLLGWLYGAELSGQQAILTILALAALVGCYGMVLDQALRALERPDLSCKTGFAGLVTRVAATLGFTLGWGVFGAACGYLTSEAMVALLRCMAFRRLTTQAEGERP